MKEEILNSMDTFGIPLVIILLTFLVAYLVDLFFKRLIRKSTEEMKNDPTNYKFFRHAIRAILYVTGISIAIYTMPSLRVLANSLLAGAGVLAVAVGFASQHALGNIISGIFIVIFKPFRVNDRLSLGELAGIVEDITLRHTVIRDFENRRIIIPNSKISDEIIINADFGDDKICKWIEIGIGYDSDIEKAKEIIKNQIICHPLSIDNRTPKETAEGMEVVPVKVVELGESSVNLRGFAWAKNSADAFNMQCDLLESIKLQFDKENIDIPFPHRTLVYKDNPTKERKQYEQA
ncbi:mechanosensitive ion channel family protein [Flagellimonas hymeniacidonis]|uniref:Mechanosensitive ion channel family protein n=1 Tax=Flagellimonas hymeniacidonis TaxID=2603628 RepID=A0A5C8V3U2_9FLAO|nr:mechanosensitive ion channel family protein [Flagellimonas hymeniacidonis]TXN36056.1 mechanosensitive ion channel family protein [Flagellimonas hymeniacidonis]